MTKKIFQKFYTRQRDLLTAGYWYRGECFGLKELTEGSVYFKPLFVYKEGGGMEVYYDMIDPNQDPELLIPFFEKHPEKFRKAVDEYEHSFNKMDQLLQAGSADNLSELLKLAERSWVGLVVIVLVSREVENPAVQEIVRRAYEVRSTTDKLEHDLYGGIIRLIAKKYPKLEKYADLFLLEEALKGTLPTQKEFEERVEGFVYYEGRLITNMNRNEFARENNVTFITEDIDFKEEISGQIAHKGKVSGVVRVFIIPRDFEKFKEGDILVAPMTTPAYMPLIRIAAAIVTDEGGITCHAAIIARELKKPCIIGTKIATQVLKDGDEIEVDADNGVVKILKHHA